MVKNLNNLIDYLDYTFSNELNKNQIDRICGQVKEIVANVISDFSNSHRNIESEIRDRYLQV